MGAEVEGDIKNRSPNTAHHFCFGVRGSLVMNAAQSTFLKVERKVALYEPGIQPVVPELGFAPRTGEEPALVPVRVDSNFKNTSQFGFRENHQLRLVNSYSSLPFTFLA